MILSFPNKLRGVGRNAIDLPVAGFAAAAVAFLAFAMPGDLLTDLVSASGLPSILTAAEPPLGYKARVGVGLIGAALVFALVFALLRFLDRTGYDSAEKSVEPEAPRARRRDAHPDAPAPRPISAVREFGEPSPPVAAPPPAEIVPQPAPAPKPEPAGESLTKLMARLEDGLKRRRMVSGTVPAAPAPQVFPEANDDRLQSAIDSLQRLTARHG